MIANEYEKNKNDVSGFPRCFFCFSLMISFSFLLFFDFYFLPLPEFPVKEEAFEGDDVLGEELLSPLPPAAPEENVLERPTVVLSVETKTK